MLRRKRLPLLLQLLLPVFHMDTDHLFVLCRVEPLRTFLVIAWQQLQDPPVRHHRAALTDAARLLVMETDIEKRKPLRRVVPQNLMQLVQLLIADQFANLIQYDEFLSKHDSTQQFQDETLKDCQPLHRHIGRNIHSDIRQKWQKLPAQKSGTDHFLTKSFSENENVVCDT